MSRHHGEFARPPDGSACPPVEATMQSAASANGTQPTSQRARTAIRRRSGVCATT